MSSGPERPGGYPRKSSRKGMATAPGRTYRRANGTGPMATTRNSQNVDINRLSIGCGGYLTFDPFGINISIGRGSLFFPA
jgi:hypothetical protein